MKLKQGRFITLEGSEGAGKSTAMEFIQKMMADAGKEVVMTREPGGTEVADEIRKLLLHPGTNEKMCALTELLMMFASRAQHIQKRILPALEEGKWVVSDRYVDATYAYQGGGRGLPMELIKQLDDMVVDQLYPDLTLLLDVPSDVGYLRTERRPTEKDRIEQEKVEFFMRVRQTYLDRAKQFPERIKVIDASQSIASVQSQIQEVLEPFMLSKTT